MIRCAIVLIQHYLSFSWTQESLVLLISRCAIVLIQDYLSILGHRIIGSVNFKMCNSFNTALSVFSWTQESLVLFISRYAIVLIQHYLSILGRRSLGSVDFTSLSQVMDIVISNNGLHCLK